MRKTFLFKTLYLTGFCLVLMNVNLFAQDTIRVMQYNLLRYGESNQPPSTKNPLLSTIINYVKPDIFGCNELSATADYAQNVLTGALNINGETKWKRAKLSKAGVDASLTNTLFYNSKKFELISQDTVSKVQREITAFNLFYKDSNLVKTKDTIFFTVIVLHLKAGNGSAEAATRAAETQQVARYMKRFSKPRNILIMGDFNIYTHTELGYQNLIADTNLMGRFYDPLNKPGAWNNNGSFSAIHTQSTHSATGGSFSGGGMDDRFDIMLATKSIISDSLKVRILPNTYIPVGNDGLHFNLALTDLPVNTSVPSNVLGALYNMSDHLPIRADFIFTPTKPAVQGLSIKHVQFAQQIQLSNPVKNNFEIHFSANLLNQIINLKIYNQSGHLVESQKIATANSDLQITPAVSLPEGIYLLRFENKEGLSVIKKIAKY